MGIENVHTKCTRKRIDIKLPKLLLRKIDESCKQKMISRTAYIENLIRYDLKKRNIEIELPINHGSFEDWGWEEKPELKRVIPVNCYLL
jgi:hypothetical protein